MGDAEFLFWFFTTHSRYGRQTLELLYAKTNLEIVTGGRNWLVAGTEFYRKRPDKAWSGVDCFSMLVMQSKGIQDVLTTDHHFRQAGFNVLMLEP